jgi:hypothetical protein
MALQKWKELNPDCNFMEDFVAKYKEKFQELVEAEGIQGNIQIELDSDLVCVIGDGVKVSTSYEHLQANETHWLRIQTLIPLTPNDSQA